MDWLIEFDQQWLLAWNGSSSVWLDQVMLYVTRTSTWIPLMAALLVMLLRLRPWREVLMVVVSLALVILLCDQFASSLCKPLFARYRPSHEPQLLGLVDLVGGRRGGLYGFISSHAANTFGAFMFVALYLHHVKPSTLNSNPSARSSASLDPSRTLNSKPSTLNSKHYALSSATVFLWACLSSYSRIYLGLHYPGDILCGALAGLFFGWLIFRFFIQLTSPTKPYTLNSKLSLLSPLLLPITFLLTLTSVCLLSFFV